MAAGIDLNGQNAVVAGGLFVNNGFVIDSATGSPGRVVADFGALVKGAGFYQSPVVTQNGGRFQAGNSPGAASFGSFTFGPGGVSGTSSRSTTRPGPPARRRTPTARSAAGAGPGGRDGGGRRPLHLGRGPGPQADRSLQTLVNPTEAGTDVAGPMAHFDPSRPTRGRP